MTEEERLALIDVRDKLANGTYVYAPNVLDGIVPAPLSFNMNKIFYKTDCGSAACIGGWMADALLNRATPAAAREYVENGGETGDLYELFYPEDLEAWDEILPADAVKAIDNMLAHGNPRWAQVRPDLATDDEADA